MLVGFCLFCLSTLHKPGSSGKRNLNWDNTSSLGKSVAFSCLMIYVGGLGYCGVCQSWIGGPGLYKKAMWASQEQESEQHSFMVSASIPNSRFLPWLYQWWTTTCNLNKQTNKRRQKNKTIPPKVAVGLGIFTTTTTTTTTPTTTTTTTIFLCMWVHCCSLQTHQKRALDPISDSCEPPRTCWELNWGPLGKHSVLSIAAPSLQPRPWCLYYNNRKQTRAESSFLFGGRF